MRSQIKAVVGQNKNGLVNMRDKHLKVTTILYNHVGHLFIVLTSGNQKHLKVTTILKTLQVT